MNPAWLLNPAGAFLALLVVIAALTTLARVLQCRDGKDTPGKFKSYGCGEDVERPRPQPDFGFFFPFAFLFTVLHVGVLVVATVPYVDAATLGIVGLILLTLAAGFMAWTRREAD